MARPGKGTVQNLYTRALLQARQSGFVIQGEQQKAFQKALERAVLTIESRILTGQFSGPLAEARAASMKRQMTELLRAVEADMVKSGVVGTGLTVQRLADIHRDVNERLAFRYGVDPRRLTGRFDQVPTRALSAMYGRNGTAKHFQTLVRRNMTDAYRDLDTIIGAGIAQGMSADRLTRDVATLLRGGAIAAGEYGVSASALGGLKSIQSDARRIAVTEINNALREANTQSLKASPIVRAAKWQLSGRHAGLPSSPDECDDLANAQSEPDLPPGYYAPENWPLAPHPYCGCTQGGPVIFHPPSQWGAKTDDPVQPPPEPPPIPTPAPEPTPLPPVILPPVAKAAKFVPPKTPKEMDDRFYAAGVKVSDEIPPGHGNLGWGKKMGVRDAKANALALLETAEDFKRRFPGAQLEATLINRKKEGGRAALGKGAPGTSGGMVVDSLRTAEKMRVSAIAAEMYKSKHGTPWTRTDFSTPRSVMDSTFRHEAAHRMTFVATENHWKDVRRQAGVNKSWFYDNVSAYGSSDQWEEIAETFAMWSAKDYVKGTLPKQIEHFMEWLVSPSNSYGHQYIRAHDWSTPFR